MVNDVEGLGRSEDRMCSQVTLTLTLITCLPPRVHERLCSFCDMAVCVPITARYKILELRFNVICE